MAKTKKTTLKIIYSYAYYIGLCHICMPLRALPRKALSIAI